MSEWIEEPGVGIKAGILLSAVQSGAEHTFDWRIAKLSPLGDTPDLEGRRNNQVGDEPNPELHLLKAHTLHRNDKQLLRGDFKSMRH